MPKSGGNAVLPWIARAFVLVAFLTFMRGAFRTGWNSLETDFPNYYTAAVLVRHSDAGNRAPLRKFYDWTWFAREMNYAGIDNQLGAYAAQTPLTMLPMIPLAGLPQQQAKRVWLLFNLACLTAIVWMLSRMTKIRWEYIAILLFCGYRSVESNFVYGQYYVFLSFLVVLTVYSLEQNRDRAGGFVSGVAFGLKLYTGPLLLYFAAKRKWRAVAAMIASMVCLGLLAIAMFGWSDVGYYATHVLPRTLEGGSIDPYNPGTPTLSTLLHRLFVREPELNPSPRFDAPWLIFFLRTTVQLGLIAFTILGIAFRNDKDDRQDFAWFVILLVLLSTSTASYTFVLLLVPVVLLLRDASPIESIYLAGSYILLNIDLQPAWLFPKLLLLVLLFLVTGRQYVRCIPVTWAVYCAVAIISISALDAWRHMLDYSKEPGRRYSQIAIESGALFSGYPVITRDGLFYQAWGDWRKGENHYVLRWLHVDRLQNGSSDNHADSLNFGGNALCPTAASANGPVGFELVRDRRSTFMEFDPRTNRAVPAATPLRRAAEDATTSPDGKWIAFTRETRTGQQLWLKDVASGRTLELAGGNCNNSSPAWELDSSAVIFASDCGRAFGLPALYRAPIHTISMQSP
jgi:hypothetical protein